MATEFNTQVSDGEYRLQFETNNEAHYLLMQSAARRCIDHAHMTNADRIRSMTNEELATFINRIVICHQLRKEGDCVKCPIHPAKPCDTEGIVNWLQQPAKEGE